MVLSDAGRASLCEFFSLVEAILGRIPQEYSAPIAVTISLNQNRMMLHAAAQCTKGEAAGSTPVIECIQNG
jgi:hypothetical protein